MLFTQTLRSTTNGLAILQRSLRKLCNEGHCKFCAQTRARLVSAGAGGNSELHHIPKLQAIDGVTIVAVANRTTKSAQRVADKFKIKEVGHLRMQLKEGTVLTSRQYVGQATFQFSPYMTV